MPFGLWDIGHNQFEFARWCEKDNENYAVIKVEIVSEREKRFSSLIQNIMTTADSTIIKTTFKNAYAPRQHVFYRKKWWEILSVGDQTLEINPQALAYINNEDNSQYILELKAVDIV